MMKSEFIELTGFEPTEDEYRIIEEKYMEVDLDKKVFCKNWVKGGGINRLSRQRLQKCELLEKQLKEERDRKDSFFKQGLAAETKALELKAELDSIILEKNEEIMTLENQVNYYKGKLNKLADAVKILEEMKTW